MADQPKTTEARATIAAFLRGEITAEEAERRADAWYAKHMPRRQPEPEQPKQD